MQIFVGIGVLIVSYLIGSVPIGLLIVKFKTGKDIRDIESGRTGGTNVVRAAGFWAGFVTAIMDILKGAVAVWIAQWISPENELLHVLAPVCAILGHNYSVFLLQRDETGKMRFHGGAGGATALGGALGIYPPIFPVIFFAGALLWFTTGIASVTTMSVGFIVTIGFAINAYLGLQPPVDILYGILASFLLVWALRPNIKKLMQGNERVVKYSLNGWLRARKAAKEADKQ
jgi:glycerol-3-phosphate acyltransferase PlsY